MAKRTRNLAMAAVAAAVLGTPGLSAAADAIPGTPMPGPHVRSSNSELSALIKQAGERSATFRDLVDTINASDSLVFVEAGDCRHGVRACFVSVTATKSYRYMRVVVDTRKADSDLMGSIGHELRHTLEVIAEPISVTTPPSTSSTSKSAPEAPRPHARRRLQSMRATPCAPKFAGSTNKRSDGWP